MNIALSQRQSPQKTLTECGVALVAAPSVATRRLITLGTPHGGTGTVTGWPQALRRLRPDSPLLAKLNAGDRVPLQFDVTAISSGFDALVAPPSCGVYPGAFNIQIRDLGHSAMLFSRRVLTLIEENLGPVSN